MGNDDEEPKCMRPGRITSNGYLNFLRDFRKKCCGLSPVELVVAGAKAWNKLTCEQKLKYTREAAKRPKRPRCPKKKKKKRKCKARRRTACRKKRKPSCAKKRKPSCKKKRNSCSKRRKPACPKKRKPACPKKRKPACKPKKPKCCPNRMKPGPPTNNPFLNFLRYMRRHNCNLTSQELMKLAARKWKCLSDNEKKRFREEACRNTKSPRRKCSKFCREYRAASRKRRMERNKRKNGSSC